LEDALMRGIELGQSKMKAENEIMKETLQEVFYFLSTKGGPIPYCKKLISRAFGDLEKGGE
ncbi:hypothetical protein EBZ39_05700, partial [bacterium]|nr:hypothetical protein [bacterium]